MRENPKPYEVYRHFKGNQYQILTIAKHTETDEQMVIYKRIEGEGYFARPLDNFMGEVDKEKYPEASQLFRFELDELEIGEKPDPMVIQFLEADNYEERLNILVGLHHRITDDMITTMAIAIDVQVDEGNLQERYESLKHCMMTLEKFESNRLK